jgi:8-oxo-dGTP pyrophosphatase MutT (NUDIX family)
MEKKNGPWTILGSREIYKTPWMDIREDSVISPSGKKTTFGVTSFRNWVLTVPVDSEGNIYLVRQFRYALGKESIEVPAGCIDEGEEPLKAAKRELEEEIGMKAKKWTSLGETWISPSRVNTRIYAYLAEDLVPGKTSFDESENVDGLSTLKIPIEKALKMIETGEIVDMPACGLILRAARILDKLR